VSRRQLRQWDFTAKKIIRFSSQRVTLGVDIYNLLNNNVTLGFNPTFVPAAAGSTPSGFWPATTSYMNPRVFRLNAEFSW